MKVHWFQHVPFEGLGAIEQWLLARGHTLSCTRFTRMKYSHSFDFSLEMQQIPQR
jgi:hypothetical protein